MKEAGFLLTEQDRENNAIIKNLVKNHFALDEASLEYFNRQIDNPLIDDVYFKAFEKFESPRIELDLPTKLQETLDYGWQNIVKIYFNDFLEETGATYENFKSNKIEINKNFFKFKKAIYKFCIDKMFKLIDDVVSLYTQDVTIKNYAYDKRRYISRFFPSVISREIDSVLYNYIYYYLTEEYNEAKIYKSYIEDNVDRAVNNVWRDVSNQKLSSDSLKIVITFSYADWFMCSTNESWGSCLALTGSSANYWYGLPGLIGDKNRVMIYITRGDEKEYRGIKTHHYLYRTWALLDGKNRVNIVRWFPKEDLHNKAIYDFLQKETGLFFNIDNLPNNHDFQSKHEVELIWNTDGYSMFPYQDYTDWTEGDETFIISGDSGMLYKEKRSSSRIVLSDELYSYNAFSSLGDLIERNTNVCDARDEGHICEVCGDRFDYEHELIEVPSGELMCSSCFHEQYFECEECGDTCNIDEAFHTEDGLVCDQCFHDNYFIDEIDSETYPVEYAVVATDVREGNYEFLTHVKNAEKYGYIFNEDDQIYYKPQYMVLINDEWVHRDVAEKGQLEFELAV
jgi:hypothetical protein